MTTIIFPRHGYFNSSIKNALSALGKLAYSQRLRFSTIDEIGNSILALDDNKMQLLYTQNSPGSRCVSVDLKNLAECSISKHYGGINAGDLLEKPVSKFLKRISLKLRFLNGASPLELSLFDASENQAVNVEQLEVKASRWTTIISKLIPNKKLSAAKPNTVSTM